MGTCELLRRVKRPFPRRVSDEVRSEPIMFEVAQIR